jgi:DNA-binding XRE family transcriptional regulator
VRTRSSCPKGGCEEALRLTPPHPWEEIFFGVGQLYSVSYCAHFLMDQLHAYIEYAFNAFYNPLVTDELKKMIEAALASGETEATLAKAIHVSQATVSRLARGDVSESSKSGRALLRHLKQPRGVAMKTEIVTAVERLVRRHPAKRRAIMELMRSISRLLD